QGVRAGRGRRGSESSDPQAPPLSVRARDRHPLLPLLSQSPRGASGAASALAPAPPRWHEAEQGGPPPPAEIPSRRARAGPLGSAAGDAFREPVAPASRRNSLAGGAPHRGQPTEPSQLPDARPKPDARWERPTPS